MKLHFENDWRDSYGGNHYTLKSISPKDALQTILYYATDINISRFLPIYISASTQIRQRIPRILWTDPFRGFNEHFLALDCDSLNEWIAVCHVCKRDNINYTTIQSSIDKYWVITDIVGTVYYLLDIMKTIPGVDKNYYDWCYTHTTIALRAFSCPYRVPSFSGIGTLKNEKVIKWYHEFVAFHQHSSMVKALANMKLKLGINDGTLMEIASNPQFQI